MSTGNEALPAHPLKGRTVASPLGPVTVVDWFIRVTGSPWQELRGENRLATAYARRFSRLSPGQRLLLRDSKTVVCKDKSGQLVMLHDSELEKDE